MRIRLLVTGGGGFAAGNLIQQARTDPSIEVHAIEVGDVPDTGPGVRWHVLDLLDSEGVRSTFARVKPDVLVHAAAVSDIDYCEENQELAEQVNVAATETLVRLCAETGCRLIYFSTDSVFDGNSGNYTEEDLPRPLNFYARTKLRSESLIRNHGTNWVIIRPSLIMGLPVWEKGNSFLWRMLGSLRRAEEVYFPKGEVRTPIDVITLSAAVLELSQHSYTGTLHLAGNTAVSRYEMARRIAGAFGYPPRLVVDKKPPGSRSRAARPVKASLCNDRARALLNTPMLDLNEGIELILTTMQEAAM